MTIRLLLSLLLLTVGAVAQQEAQVRRLKDLVMVRQGIDATERSLFAHDPVALLAVGDELEQGGAASSVLVVPAPDLSGDSQGSTLMRFYGPAMIRLVASGDEADALRVPLVTHMEAEVGPRVLVLQFPGDISLSMRETSLALHSEPGRLRVRNTGGEAIRLTGPIAVARGMLESSGPTTRILVQRGEEVRVPLYTAPLGSEGRSQGQWGPLTIRFEEGVLPSGSGWRLQLAATDVDGGWASLGGVWTRARPGRMLMVTDQRRFGQPFTMTVEPEEAPEFIETPEIEPEPAPEVDPEADPEEGPEDVPADDEPEEDEEDEP